MPLKHRTETLFVVLLAIALMLTGFALASLPPLPQGIIPWAIVFVLTLLYPAVLMPFYRRERADHEFRSLHWFPMTMTLLWLGFAVLAWFVPAATIALKAYTWAWLLPMVSFAILGLLLFCSKVIRQWAKRTVLVLLTFVPFAALALWSSTGPHFEQIVAQSVWGGGLFAQNVSEPIAGIIDTIDLPELSDVPDVINIDSSTSSEPSSDTSSSLTDSETAWQEFLTDFEGEAPSSSSVSTTSSVSTVTSASSEEDSKTGILGFLDFTKEESSVPPMFAGETDSDSLGSSSVSTMNSSSVSSQPLLIGQNSSVPTHLPNSGFGWSVIILSLIALYSAVLHKRQLGLA